MTATKKPGKRELARQEKAERCERHWALIKAIEQAFPNAHEHEVADRIANGLRELILDPDEWDYTADDLTAALRAVADRVGEIDAIVRGIYAR